MDLKEKNDIKDSIAELIKQNIYYNFQFIMYKNKVDNLREYIKECDFLDKEVENERLLQILNEGDK